VLLGPAGSGKTTIAAAFLHAAVERDPDLRVRFVPAEDLLREETPDGGPTPLEQALSADVLALDDAGAELEGAPTGSGLLAQRMGALSKVISKRFDRGAPMLVTTGLERDAFTELYGDRLSRRLFEGARVIRIGGGAS
jgi:DNA replication protein DnaC